MKKQNLPLSQVYRFIEPGPVVLVTTALKGVPNIMTMSWHTMMEFEPPIIGCVISDRDYTFNILKKTKECAINIPTANLAKAVVGCGNISGRHLDKFKAFHLTPVAAKTIEAPLVEECYVNLECKVMDTKLVNTYNFFILQVLKAWIASEKKRHQTLHHLGKGVFEVSGKTIKLPSKMK